jgi:hypothetical protein
MNKAKSDISYVENDRYTFGPMSDTRKNYHHTTKIRPYSSKLDIKNKPENIKKARKLMELGFECVYKQKQILLQSVHCSSNDDKRILHMKQKDLIAKYRADYVKLEKRNEAKEMSDSDNESS